jgi:sigma-B regulation protein RsbU (phosphoserine phosphatase)
MSTLRTQKQRPISVLVVEDNPDHRFLIERRLADEGIQVQVVATGEEAITRLDGVDIVLLDYRLEGSMDGLQTLAAIRGRKGPSVLMVTGMGSEDLAVQAMRAGALDYVVKDQSYLAALPEIVDRAWRHHDLARRASELQQLALLIASAEDRDTVFNEVVSGAAELMDATTCALFLFKDEQLQLAAVSGEVGDSLDAMQATAMSALSHGLEDPLLDEGDLYVCLHKRNDDPVGIFVTHHEDQPSPGDIELVQAFASFAGVAVKNFLRLELERELLAQVRQTVEMRRDFVSSISHELRTPLACISGFSKTLQDRWDDLDEPTIKDCLDRIYKHSMDLADLVQEVLDFRSTETTRYSADMHPLDL